LFVLSICSASSPSLTRLATYSYQHIILRNIDNVRTKAAATKGGANKGKGKEKEKETVQVHEDPLYVNGAKGDSDDA
jgi:hypothetical protein